jgi:hypothetical protein
MNSSYVRHMPAHLACGLTLLALTTLLVVSGCEKRKPPPASPQASVSIEEAAAATYPSENTTGGFLRLTNGHYEDKDMVISDLDELSATGELDADGNDDRAVLLITSTGGSGVFREIYALRRVNGQLQVSKPALLGDRVEVHAITIDRGEIVTDLVVQGPDDPLCCPTQAVTYRYRLADNALLETTGQQRVYLKQ